MDAPEGIKHKDNSGIMIASVAGFILLSLTAVIFLYNQNQALKTQLAAYHSMATPTPVAIQSPNPLPTVSTPSATVKPVTKTAKYTCPVGGYVDCMPGTDKSKPECSTEAISWYKANCPDFKGAVY